MKYENCLARVGFVRINAGKLRWCDPALRISSSAWKALICEEFTTQRRQSVRPKIVDLSKLNPQSPPSEDVRDRNETLCRQRNLPSFIAALRGLCLASWRGRMFPTF